MSGSTRDWDARCYDRVSGPQVAMAGPVIERLELAGHETVLDAGCDSGRVTRLLLERLPHGRVIGVDAAPSMVAEARAALGDEAEVLLCDLVELELNEQVDAAFSNAVFHWVPDHDALFARLHAALRPGGRVAAQCGGAGNVERFHELASAVSREQPFAEHLSGWEGPWNFAEPGETHERLERAGFGAVEVWLEPHPVVPEYTEDYLRTVCLGSHLERLPAELREPYVRAVAKRCGRPVELDYVRLNIVCRRPG